VDTPFEFVFPAIRGVQARREFYVSMCPLRVIPKMFVADEEDVLPELRAQRTLNKGRIPALASYIVDNRDSYTFSALTASIDGDVRFEPIGAGPEGKRVGVLHVPMASRFIMNDGQHRRAAIERAVRERPDLADESIAVVFFLDLGLERCQQMFADLNRHVVRPSASIGVLYDHRDEAAQVTKAAISRVPLFKDLTETSSGTIAARSRKLFTLSALYAATRALLAGTEDKPIEARVEIAVAAWAELAQHFPEWQQVHSRRIAADDVRRDFLHPHGVILQALARVVRSLLHDQPYTWKNPLSHLSQIDWSRNNAAVWEGRVLVAGKVSKGTNNVVLATNLIKQRLDLPLTMEEQATEDAFQRGSRVEH